VYRGDLMSLVDTDLNGLVDGGWGGCVNHLDPDLADGVFVDAEMPPPGGGYFYLMERVRGGIAEGLGTTSAGAARVPATPCPSGSQALQPEGAGRAHARDDQRTRVDHGTDLDRSGTVGERDLRDGGHRQQPVPRR
jgi:hypothetical protein